MGQALVTLEVELICGSYGSRQHYIDLFFDLCIKIMQVPIGVNRPSMKCNNTQLYAFHVGINLYDDLRSTHTH
jgi:hypothetical protein